MTTYLGRLPRVLTAVDRHLDEMVAADYKDQPLAQDWARVGKVIEELGEAIRALIAYTGQNPRKGVHGTEGEMLDELADVACTGLLAMQHFTKDSERTMAIFMACVDKIFSRVVPAA